MRGLMSERPLLISGILQHAANFHADTEIVSRLVDGSIHRYAYADAERRWAREIREFPDVPGTSLRHAGLDDPTEQDHRGRGRVGPVS